jgi:hypothetical protein
MKVFGRHEDVEKGISKIPREGPDSRTSLGYALTNQACLGIVAPFPI